MPLVPPEPEAPPTRVERVSNAIVEPVRSHRPVIVLALSAGAASLAPEPFGAIAATLLVVFAWDAGRRK